MRLDFECGCFQEIWVEANRLQSGIGCCRKHDRERRYSAAGKTVKTVTADAVGIPAPRPSPVSNFIAQKR